MKFIKLIGFDFMNGIVREYKKYFFVIITFSVFFFDFFFRQQAVYINGLNESRATFTDCIIYCFGGMKEYIPNSFEPFIFPIIWLIVHLLILYTTLYYAYNDLMKFGQQIIIRTKRRILWWFSKCIHIILSVIIFYIIAYLTIFLFCIIAKIPISFDFNTQFISGIFNLSITREINQTEMFYTLFVLPPLVSIGISLLQMFLTLFIKPLFSFCTIASLLLISSYWMSPIIIGNYAMPIRSIQIIENGIDLKVGIVYALIISLTSIIAGAIQFKYYDILSEK